MDKRICTKCGAEKPVTDFYPDKKGKDGIGYYCQSCMRKKSRLWKLNNHSRHIANNNSWRARNKDKDLQYHKKSRSTIKGRLNSSIGGLIWKALRKNKAGYSWEKLVGYTAEDLKRHLESKFTDGMTWEAFMHGEIHIDHIIPKSRFRFSGPHDPEIKVCWGLDNLQPLWAKDNLSKWNKTTGVDFYKRGSGNKYY